MAKLRKLAGWLPAVGAMIFNGCVIGWLHCTKPQLLGSLVPGNVIAVGYPILFLLWWCLATAATACVIGGPFFLWCAALLPAELLFALTALRQVWPVGVLLAVLKLAGVFWFRRRSFRLFRRQSRRCGYDDFALLCGEDRVRENCRRFGVLLATLLLAVPACWGRRQRCWSACGSRQMRSRLLSSPLGYCRFLAFWQMAVYRRSWRDRRSRQSMRLLLEWSLPGS